MSSQFFEKIRLLDDADLRSIIEYAEESIYAATGFRVACLEDYHVSHSEHHRIMCRKSSREFGEQTVREIINLPGIRGLRERFAGFSVGNVVDEHGIASRPEVYFRLVRPHSTEDVGCPHMDHWFHYIAGLPYRIGSTYKVWISLVSEPGLSGLQFYPDADVGEIEWKHRKGTIHCDVGQTALGAAYLPAIEPGEAFIFRDDVLHSGAVNLGHKTRASVEITFVPGAP